MDWTVWRKGGCFCFLPIAGSESFTPIHFNAFFALTPARDAICHSKSQSGPSEKFDSATRVKWNEAILSEGVAQCYADLILASRRFCTRHKASSKTGGETV
eukprot:TRINITY_DN16256_c0_g1_i1.p1 TRINITY_DN16256_c0_g1~~TRINITY_DN16256_c0_g1_i1.p1  ORF type:complete len:101 (+),score=3.96 TRINITY_DN16256_c0_g1_i1:17-319(+)